MDIITPEEYMGDVIGDINSRRGSIVELSERSGMKSVESLVPLANMFQVRHLLVLIKHECRQVRKRTPVSLC